ncbi:MAG: ATP-binding protein [Bdellovibrionota bacterium]
MGLFEGLNLLILGLVIASVFGTLATLAIIFQIRANHRLSASLNEARDLHAHLARDVEAVTQVMNEGLYLLRLEHDALVVDRHYSAVLDLKVSDLQSPVEVLLRASDLDDNTINQIFGCLRASFGVSILQWDFNAKILPKELTVLREKDIRTITLKWKAIRSRDGLIAKIVLLATDTTDLKQLQEDARTRYDDAKRLMELIGNSPKKIGEYFAIVESVLSEAKSSSGEPDSAVLNFRNIHTLKGMARGYQLEELTRCLNELEDAFQDQPEPAKALQHAPALLACETALRAYKRLFLRVYTQKLASSQISVDPKLILTLTNQIETAFMRSDIQAALSAVNEIQAIFACTLDKIIIDEIGMVKKLSEDLGKPMPELYINEIDFQVSEECKVMLRKVFVHLFRNSIDHGLESEVGRRAEGKDISGQISIQAVRSTDNRSYRIRYSDDGQGLRLDKILQKALDLGLADHSHNYSDQEIADLIFESGLSTASRGSSFSGRGVGMDAVRSFLKQGGGSISIQLDRSTEGKGRPFAFIIDVPLQTPAAEIRPLKSVS